MERENDGKYRENSKKSEGNKMKMNEAVETEIRKGSYKEKKWKSSKSQKERKMNK